MRVMIDALGLPTYGGARSSALGWVGALAQHGSSHKYEVYLTRAEAELRSPSNLTQHVAPVSNRLTVRVWAQAAMPAMARSLHVGLFHATKNLGLFGMPCPTIITVNDLTHVLLAELYPKVDNLYWRQIQPLLLRRAARVIAISHSTREALLRYYELPEQQVVVIYPSIHPRYLATAGGALRARVRARYRLPQQYVLYVGGLGLHKNVRTLVQAFYRLACELPHGLVLVGGRYHSSSDLALLAEAREGGPKQRLWLLDRVPDEEMPALYQMADLFVLPSLSEGFGLALLEAMASNTPVVASPVGAIGEVAGDAAAWVQDPLDASELARVIAGLVASPGARQELMAKGRARLSHFSWEATARQTLALYDQVVAQSQ